MKNIQSTIEGIWTELNQVVLSKDQKVILEGKDQNAIKELQDTLKSQREVPAQDSDISICQAKYLSIKPILTNTDVYQLIAINVNLDAENCSGILNCRVNGEHKQIRF